MFCCISDSLRFFIVFFFNDTATTEIYTLSLHDALPIFADNIKQLVDGGISREVQAIAHLSLFRAQQRSYRLNSNERRSEEHTSELQSPVHLVCRLLLEKKKKKISNIIAQISQKLASIHT